MYYGICILLKKRKKMAFKEDEQIIMFANFKANHLKAKKDESNWIFNRELEMYGVSGGAEVHSHCKFST